MVSLNVCLNEYLYLFCFILFYVFGYEARRGGRGPRPAVQGDSLLEEGFLRRLRGVRRGAPG